jgi:hypothetical protein
MTHWRAIELEHREGQRPGRPYANSDAGFEKQEELLIAARYPRTGEVEIWICVHGKGLFYPRGDNLSVDEHGFVPFAWSDDLPPPPPGV